MNQRTRFLGLDVHKETIAVAIAEEGSEPQLHSTIANRPEAVRKLVRQVGGDVRLVAAYEAGPTGYAVHRQLVQLGVDSKVVAPSLIPRAAGDRVKTDRRDAVRLARLLRGGDLVPVWIPDDEHEALRDLVRTRADAKVDLLRARHRLSKFLLRRGLVPPPFGVIEGPPDFGLGFGSGGIDDAADLGDLVGGEAALLGVLSDHLLVGSDVDAVNLVVHDVAVEPLDLRAHTAEDTA